MKVRRFRVGSFCWSSACNSCFSAYMYWGSVCRVWESNSSLTKQICALFCTVNIQFQQPMISAFFLLLKSPSAKNLSVCLTLSSCHNGKDIWQCFVQQQRVLCQGHQCKRQQYINTEPCLVSLRKVFGFRFCRGLSAELCHVNSIYVCPFTSFIFVFFFFSIRAWK